MVTNGCAQNVPEKRLYSIKELVCYIGATEWFWRSQIWDGQLPYVQVGRKMFIDRNDVESFIQNNKVRN
ncbi:MAG TPA: helix-turn-helix domain-containing protein [Deltaproteobacteria bacterium]|nr:helix-turn-helix domain-containing protein [Deltaproteobacteria bacterium]